MFTSNVSVNVDLKFVVFSYRHCYSIRIGISHFLGSQYLHYKLGVKVSGAPNHMNPKKPTPRLIIIKMPKVKDKEEILKAAREKQLVTY